MSSTSATPFPIDNLPYGVISTPENPTPRCATVLESNAIDLSALEREGYFDGIPGFQADGGIFSQPTLNTFAALPNATRKQVRAVLTTQLAENPDDIVANPKYATSLQRVTNHFPMDTRNFSDFYCSLEHTQNCSALLNSAIPENWFFIPSVYNGRTSSLRVSGTPVRRPNGVFRDTSQGSSPKFQPSKRFDFELEVGIFLSRPLPPGEILNIADAKDHIFGLVILNDWSARDIQVFEMPPLGPFHGKGAGTSISPWIVTTEALGGALCGRAKGQDPSPLGHLSWVGNGGVPGQETWDVELGVRIIRNGKSYTVTETNLNELYWTPYQQLVHLASAGEGLSTGDIFGTGTLTSARRNAAGENTGIACLLERQLPQNKLTTLTADGIVYLEDGDEVVMDGWCVNRTTGRKFGFGECRGVVLPALEV